MDRILSSLFPHRQPNTTELADSLAEQGRGRASCQGDWYPGGAVGPGALPDSISAGTWRDTAAFRLSSDTTSLAAFLLSSSHLESREIN